MPRGFGRGFGMRRPGMGIFPAGGFGFGMGSPLMSGILGYLLGSSSRSGYNQQPQQEPENKEPEKKPDKTEEKLAKLKLLAELHDRGVLTDEEFEKEKEKILND